MKRFGMIAVVTITLWSAASAASRIEIPLSELHGLYEPSCCSCSQSRITTFSFDRIPVNVYSVSLKLIGLETAGEYWCDWYVYTRAWSMQFVAIIQDSMAGSLWRADKVVPLHDPDLVPLPLNPFPFEIEVPFVAESGASWEFLSAGRAAVSFSGRPALIPSCGLGCISSPRPFAEIYMAVLIIEADCLIGVDQTTWGSVKALYSH